MDRFLPIGTVCRLKTNNRLIMITGYCSPEFVGDIKFKDYTGCVFPEGLSKIGQLCDFDHTDINEVIFKGYENEERKVLNNLLLKAFGEDSISQSKEDYVLASSDSYSKLLFDENGVVMIANVNEKKDDVDKEKKTFIDEYEFDETGTVISITKKDNIKNPFHKDLNSNSEPKKVNYSSIIKSNISNKVSEKDLNTLNDIKFDENGVVISDGVNSGEMISEKKETTEKTNQPPKSKYKFDENGVVISASLNPYEELSKKRNFSERTNQSPKIKYKFDENGVVISN